MNNFSQAMTIMGTVTGRDLAETGPSFEVQCRSGDKFTVQVGSETYFEVVRNLDGENLDRYPNPPGFDFGKPADRIRKYLGVDGSPGPLVTVHGILQEHQGRTRFEGRQVFLVQREDGSYLFEQPHWWIYQSTRLADQWLDVLFGDKRAYELEDFVKLYQTNLSIAGMPDDDNLQECAVLSRLIYGLSAAYLISGDERYRLAAQAGVKFQRDAFRSVSHDGQYCFWAFGRRRRKYGTQIIIGSEFEDDKNSIPLYEQIYALAGLAQYYRISLDWEVLEDIRRTIRAFNAYYLDEKSEDPTRPGFGGYFSHIDYATMRPDRNEKPANNNKKNWNSVGDHIPAYLINLLITLDPLPQGQQRQDLQELYDTCRTMLDRTTSLILDKFPDPASPYVNERFDEEWNPDHSYGWQQNRAVVGHNFKIAWNLTRVASYYDYLVQQRRPVPKGGVDPAEMSKRCMELANKLCRAMTGLGIDQIRGGCFDAVERNPSNGMPVQFSWGNTKDFWQQEQAILAYLILHGYTGDADYLTHSRDMCAFWNLFFLDREHRSMYFRVNDNGLPVLSGQYGKKGGHSDAAGYHVFELNYLAHVYTRAYVAPGTGSDPTFCIYFKPDRYTELRSINVLPDFIAPDRVRIAQVTINGVPRRLIVSDQFQLELREEDLGCDIMVMFRGVPGAKSSGESKTKSKGRKQASAKGGAGRRGASARRAKES
ncbi:MAG: AGE family epimerase/isomerase [Tepidisphaeraceae bacterium]